MTEVVLHGTIRLDSNVRSENVHFHDSFWRKQTLATTKLLLSLTRVDFAVAVSSRAVRVFQALLLRRVRPSYGTFSLMVFQGNCARGRTGHMISHLFNQQDSSLGRHVNAASAKTLETQAYCVIKPRTHSDRKFVRILVFSCSYTS